MSVPLQTKPCTCLLYPACGHVPPPVVDTRIIVERDRKAAVPPPKRKVGRPKSPWVQRKLDEQKRMDEVADQIIMATENVEMRAALLRQVDSLLARADFAEYCRQAWHVVEPSTELEWNWHHELICKIIQGAFEDWMRGQDDKKFIQQVRNIVFNVPPGSLKSRILCVFFPTWAWIHRPGWKVICLSVNEVVAHRDARDSRNLIRSDWYQTMFQPDWSIKGDQDAISNYGNTRGGNRLSRAQASEIVGLRGDCWEGSTLVATEVGEMSIAALHDMATSGQELPRVWSLNHATGDLELRSVQATRRIDERPVTRVSTGNQTLRCTSDHRIWNGKEYILAGVSDGETVPVLTGTVPGFVGSTTLSVKDYGEVAPVYDIQVDGNHNFLVGNLDEFIVSHNCILIDDPNNPKEAESAAVRNEVNELWKNNIFNRVNDMTRSVRIGIQQRTHALDWTGFVTKTDGVWTPEDPNPNKWLHVVIPAEYEPQRRCVTPWGSDPRTEPGESLHPARMTKDFLEAERARFGSQAYAGQMQQRPVLAEGGRVKTTWLNWCRLAEGVNPLVDAQRDTWNRPRPDGSNKSDALTINGLHGYRVGYDLDWVVISVDPAAKKTERGSNYGILVIGGKGMRRFILDDQSRRGEITDILKVLKDLIIKWKPDRILIEAKAAGPSLMTMFTQELQNGNIRDVNGKPIVVVVEPVEPGSSDKETRFDACIPQIEAGLLYILDGAPWTDEFCDELCMFPLGAYDDRVDALSQCLNHMTAQSGYFLPKW